jgi:hypothetical protein
LRDGAAVVFVGVVFKMKLKLINSSE